MVEKIQKGTETNDDPCLTRETLDGLKIAG